MSPDETSRLIETALRIKKRFLTMYRDANAGHVGSALSVAEILTFVRFGWVAEGDEIILSKGHAAAALYAMLAEEGALSAEKIATFYRDGTDLAAHPPPNRLPRIPFATGSLGHGLSLACGFGMARRFKRSDSRIFCITSDGELNEGSTWEAALFLAHHGLNNVTWLIDRNHLQGFGRTEETLRLEPLDRKLEAFGFAVFSVDGHDFESLIACRKRVLAEKRPSVMICTTRKGNGWNRLENTVDSHYLPMTAQDYSDLISPLGEDPANPSGSPKT